jgi:hypothetical protein
MMSWITLIPSNQKQPIKQKEKTMSNKTLTAAMFMALSVAEQAIALKTGQFKPTTLEAIQVQKPEDRATFIVPMLFEKPCLIHTQQGQSKGWKHQAWQVTGCDLKYLVYPSTAVSTLNQPMAGVVATLVGSPVALKEDITDGEDGTPVTTWIPLLDEQGQPVITGPEVRDVLDFKVGKGAKFGTNSKVEVYLFQPQTGCVKKKVSKKNDKGDSSDIWVTDDAYLPGVDWALTHSLMAFAETNPDLAPLFLQAIKEFGNREGSGSAADAMKTSDATTAEEDPMANAQ